MTEAHRILSAETHQLGVAAADLFRRCERLQDEFRDQIRRANELAASIERVTSAGPNEDESVDEVLMKRLERARTNQEGLRERHDLLRRKIGRSGARELSEKEKLWVNEIQGVAQCVMEPEQENGERDEDQDSEWETEQNAELWTRYSEVLLIHNLPKEITSDSSYKQARDLANEYVSQAKEVATDNQAEPNGTIKVPPDLRKAKVAQVMELLEREYVSTIFSTSLPRLSR